MVWLGEESIGGTFKCGLRQRLLRPPVTLLSIDTPPSTMALEDFEKSLAADKEREQKGNSDRHRGEERKHHHHRHHHRDSDEHHHGPKRKDHPAEGDEREHRRRKHRHHESSHHSSSREEGGESIGEDKTEADPATFNPVQNDKVTRDSWMEAPSSLDIDYTQKGYKKPPEPTIQTSTKKKDFQLKIHDNELNKHHLQVLADGKDMSEDVAEEPSKHEVNYTFGDAGSQWRMRKLKRVYERAKEEHKAVDEIATEQFEDLKSLDDAREEQIELDRRATYGSGYVGKEKPSGDLFAERKLDIEVRRQPQTLDDDNEAENELEKVLKTVSAPAAPVPIDQTALNRLKAQMMKAKLRGGPQAEALEAKYNSALASFASLKQPDVLVLSTMENRMLAGGRSGEVKAIDNKRGRERGLVEANDDMSIDDMVREERRTRTQQGGDSARFAERIAKDGKFDNDLDYMDENAAKLAKRVQKSEVNLKNTAVSEFQKMNRILDTCPLCHHEDTNQPPLAPVVSLATRVYLTLPTQPELSEGSASIIPIQHHVNLLECDDDEWEEVRNFMKSLTRMYHDQGRSVIFYENAAAPQRRRHASLEAVPLPYSLGDIAPQFFKEAVLAADEEWTQHKKLIDTLAKSRAGLGKGAFRRSLVKEMPYFHVWFEIDGGLGHIVEDANRWPKGDLFAREIVGGMLDLGPEVVKRQGKWSKGDSRVEPFRKRWRKFDWTRVLTDG